jgi:flagellin
MRINTNVASLNAQENATNTNKALTSSLEKLSSGLRINKAADDASGLAIADKLRTQASSLGQGISNANSASALIQIADKAMAEQSNILDTVKSKLIQASTSTTNSDGREAIRKDINKLLTQFDNIASQTNYNGTTLLQKSATETSKQDTLSFQLGEDSTFDVTVQLTKASNTDNLGGGSDTLTSGTNVDFGDTQYIVSTGTTTVKNVLLTETGGEVMTENTTGVDVYVTGDLGTAFTANSGNTIFDVSNQSEDTLSKLSILAASKSSYITYDSAAATLTIASTTATDLSEIDFSYVNVTNSLISIAAFTIANTSGVSIKNDIQTATTSLYDYKIDLAFSGTATGGDLLSSIKNLTTGGLTSDKANNYMKTIDEALTQMNANRSDFGSTQNQLESSIRNMQTTQTNLKAAESVIRDVDYASESASFNKQNIIAQAGTYAMSQANAMAQNVQRLLQ